MSSHPVVRLLSDVTSCLWALRAALSGSRLAWRPSTKAWLPLLQAGLNLSASDLVRVPGLYRKGVVAGVPSSPSFLAWNLRVRLEACLFTASAVSLVQVVLRWLYGPIAVVTSEVPAV